MAAREPHASKKMHRLLLSVDLTSGNDRPSDNSLLFACNREAIRRGSKQVGREWMANEVFHHQMTIPTRRVSERSSASFSRFEIPSRQTSDVT